MVLMVYRRPSKGHMVAYIVKQRERFIRRLIKCYMDPRIVYLRCHKLQCDELGSVQTPLKTLKEYQCLTPNKLSDINLESVLWNKVTVVLQKEVGE